MKKVVSLLLTASVISTFSLSGCGNTAPSLENGSSSGGADTDSTTNSAGPITIVYGGYEDQLMMNELAKSFEKTHLDINIEVYNNGQWLGDDQLTLLASAGNLPDIINLQNTVVPVENDWVIDLTPYYENDEYKDNMPQSIVDNGKVGNELIMLPSAIMVLGMYVNLDLLKQNNIPIPSYDWTLDDYANIVTSCTKAGSTIGCNSLSQLLEFVPSNMNLSLECGAFNPETQTYDLENEWAATADFLTNLCTKGVSIYEQLDQFGVPSDFTDGSDGQNAVVSERNDFLQQSVGETDPYVAWTKGKVAVWNDLSGYNYSTDPNYTGFNYDFYPYPVQDASNTQRVCLNVDSIGITTSCKYPEQAYEFVQYLTDDPNGFSDRIDIVNNYNKDELKAKYPDMSDNEFMYPLQVTTLPGCLNDDTIKEYIDATNAPQGLQYCINLIKDGKSYDDGYKVIPGFEDAYNNLIAKTANEQILTGKVSAADIVPSLEEQADKITQDAIAAQQSAVSQ